MNGLILYLIKSTLYTAVFQSFYLLVMRKTTFFRLNRTVFIFGTLLCLLLPFVNIEMPSESMTVTPMAMIEAALISDGEAETVAATEYMTTVNWTALTIICILVGGAVVSLSVTAISYIRMCKMIRSVRPTNVDGTEVRIIEDEIPSFSWGRHIVMSRKDLEENPAILTHEKMHVKCGHSFDLMAYTIVTTLQWFNPLVWIARTELKMLHEYEADELTIDKGIDATQYQLLLVKKAVGAKRFQLANGFNHSKLKNRITMMHKNKTNKWMRLAYLLCIPVLIGAMCCCSQNTQKGEAAEESQTAVDFTLVDVKPTFNGGDANTFSKWVNEQLVYPENCKKEGITGTVVASFTVSKTGKVTDVKVLRGVHEDIDKEVVRVISSSPDWTPGEKDGRTVPVMYNFPVIFQLRDTEKKSEAVPFQFADKKPGFNGGDANEFSKWVAQNVVYPENCKSEGISGRVTVSFTVSETGKVTDVKVLRGVHEDLDKEALRVVSSAPDWTPGQKDGKNVAVTYTFPVLFKL